MNRSSAGRPDALTRWASVSLTSTPGGRWGRRPLDQRGRDLHVELEPVGALAHPEGLVGIHIGGGQEHGPVGEREGVAVPVQAGQGRAARAQDRIGLAGGGQGDRRPRRSRVPDRWRPFRRGPVPAAGRRDRRPGPAGPRVTAREGSTFVASQECPSCTPMGPPITISPRMRPTSCGVGTSSASTVITDSPARRRRWHRQWRRVPRRGRAGAAPTGAGTALIRECG